jgi:hypothetical protein
MKNKIKFLTITLVALTISGCSQYSQSGAGGGSQHPCEVLRNNYFSEYQAYKDARAANGGVEDSSVMAHYYASAEYSIKFTQADCESQGFSLEINESGGSSQSEPEIVDTPESEIVIDMTNRLNRNSSLNWSIDQANDLTGSNVIGVVLSDDGGCGVWIFNSVNEILKAYDRGLFQYSKNWYGTDNVSQYAIMLMSEYPDNQCASDLVDTVGWDGLE